MSEEIETPHGYIGYVSNADTYEGKLHVVTISFSDHLATGASLKSVADAAIQADEAQDAYADSKQNWRQLYEDCVSDCNKDELDIAARYEEEVLELNKCIEKLEGDLDEVESKYEDLQHIEDERNYMLADLDDCEDKFDEFHDKIINLEEEAYDLEVKCTDLETDLADAQDMISTLHDEVQFHKSGGADAPF